MVILRIENETTTNEPAEKSATYTNDKGIRHIGFGISWTNAMLTIILKVISAVSVLALAGCGATISINDANRFFFEAQARNDFDKRSTFCNNRSGTRRFNTRQS